MKRSTPRPDKIPFVCPLCGQIICLATRGETGIVCRDCATFAIPRGDVVFKGVRLDGTPILEPTFH